jgi:hypothetical protein
LRAAGRAALASGQRRGGAAGRRRAAERSRPPAGAWAGAPRRAGEAERAAKTHLRVVNRRAAPLQRQRRWRGVVRPVGVEGAAEGADGGEGGAGFLDGGAQVRREVRKDGGDVAGGGAELVDRGGRAPTIERKRGR